VTTNPLCRLYLDGFYAEASGAGLHPSEPKGTNNSIRFPAIGASYIGVSVTSDRLRVNLNNDTDVDRSIFKRLVADREAIDLAIGEALDWEDIDPARAKSVIRAGRPGGYRSAQLDWPEQYAWATGIVVAFEREYRARV
jgi:hypothetical protein